MYYTAPSFKDFERVCEPYTKAGRLYVDVKHPNTGNVRSVRLYTEQEFAKVVDEVRQGQSLTYALNKYNIFPDMLKQMVAVGEKTGSLDSVLTRCCSYFDDQVATTLSAVTSIIQPVILAILGGVIGVVFYAVYSPMLSIMQNLT